VTTAYDLSKVGTGEYSIEPSNLLTYIDEDGTPKDFYATVGNIPKVKLSGNLPAPPVHEKRANFNGCSADQQTQLNAAATNAQSYAKSTYTYISGISNGTTRYATWFGAYRTGRKNTVRNHFELINSNDFASFTYDCTCTDMPDVFAYVCAYIFQPPDCYLAIDK